MVIAVALAPVEADDPVSTNVSFNREIIRIVQRKCEPCHAPSGLAMSLSDYRDARNWGRAIREELVEHRMPPAIVARGYGRYQSDPSLNAREMATFLTWLDGGMPRGDEADRPARSAALDALEDIEADAGIRLSLPEQTVPADEDVVVRRVTIDAAAIAGRAIARVQFRPGNRRVLRGAMIFARNAFSAANGDARPRRTDDVSGSGDTLWLGGWLPWQHAVVPPPQHAFRLPPRATLVAELYYRGADVALADRSSIDLSFASEAVKGRIDAIVVAADAATGSRVRGRVKLPASASVWAIHPATLEGLSSLEVRAERPDGSTEVLMWIPQARTDWPIALVMQEPVELPAGATVSVVGEMTERARADTRPRVTLSVVR
jgi:hypothetical protein